MNNTKTTKRALLSSVMAIIICVAMLIGTTFAWFTDSASTAVNKIQAGTLDVALEMKDNDGNWVNAEGHTLSWKKAAGAPASEAILWEPGCTYQLPELRIVNNGSLALKYRIIVNGIVGNAKLLEVISFTYGDGIDINAEGHLLPQAATEGIVIKGHMKEEAGNEYQGLSIDGIGITVVATQDTVESDSFDNTYDTDATYLNTDAAGNYLISNANELVYFAKTVNVDRTSYAGKTVKLTADIDLAGKTWIPVGQTGGYTAKTYFQGTFDGDGKTIKNLNVPASTWEAGTNDGQNFATGFFGFIDAGGNSIKNVTFDNATVEGHHWVGVVAGYMSGKVENVVVKNSTVTSTYKNGEADGDKAGAIAGYLNRAESVITGCTVENCVVSGVRDCGGIVGFSVAGSTTSSNTVKDTTVYYSTNNNEQIGGEIMGKRSPGTNSSNTHTNVTVTKLVAVSTAAELSNALNATYRVDTTIKLANDIDLAGVTWDAHIVRLGSCIKVVLDGNGKTISNLTASSITRANGVDSNGLITAVQDNYAALGQLSSLNFKNLTVSGATVTNKNGAASSSGVFVGDSKSVYLNFTDCKVANANVTSDAWAAGFVGYVADHQGANMTTFNRCMVINSTIKGNDGTGALIGLNNRSTTINGATVTGNTIDGGTSGWSAAALVGTAQANVVATDVTVNSNTYALTNDYAGLIRNDTYGIMFRGSNATTYTINGTDVNSLT